MRQLIKSFAGFNNPGDVVSIVLPGNTETVALRLYQEGLEVSIWALLDLSAPSAVGTTRFFMLTDTSIVPTNFVKFIGALLFGPDKKPCLVIEVTGPPTEGPVAESTIIPAV